MLANRIPGVRTQGYVNNGVMLEACALSHLAYYNLTTLTGRPLQSFINAFDITSFNFWQRVPAGRPAFLMAHINDGSTRGRYHISVEGTTGIMQHIWGLSNVTAVSAAPLAGYVFGRAWTFATDILAALAANGNFQTGIANNANTEVVFSGHSLGAMIAEILAYRIKNSHPWLRPMYCKFASPSTGTRGWYEGKNRLVQKRNIRTERDPIHVLPVTDIAASSDSGIWAWPTGLARYIIDPNCETVKVDRTMEPGYAGTHNMSLMACLDSVGAPRNRFNHWIYHNMECYRRLLKNWVATHRDLNTYRFFYLEMPDEWSEQQKLNEAVEDSWDYNLNGTAPDAVTVPQLMINEYLGIPERSEAYVRDSDSAYGGGGENWGGEVMPGTTGQFAPVPPAQIVARRVRRVGVR